MKKQILLCAVLLVALIVGGFGLWQARRFFPYPPAFARLGIENWQVWEFHDYFGLDPSEISVIIGDRRLRDLEIPPVMESGEVRLHYTFIREHIDPFIFWDAGAQALFFSTDTEVIRLPDRTVSISSVQDMYPDFMVEHRSEFNTVIISETEVIPGHTATMRITETIRDTNVRYRPDRTAFITRRAPRGTELTIFGITGDFVRVRTPEGLLGYVPAADLEQSRPWTKALAPCASSETTPLPNINLTWDLITAPVGNTTAMNNPLPEGLTVISPTWFNFDPYAPDGRLISFASREYVDWAHSHGVKVWAKAFDTNHDISAAILTNYRARERVIEQLVSFVRDYNLDGININFEHVRAAAGRYYVQFLRELAPEMRRLDATLSVATFVPAPWFRQYHHDLVGKTVDFVAIMTYDEHYSGSPEPGPVASLPFVERFMREAAELIPPEKLLMGLPLYNRIWRVIPDEGHTISNTGMAFPWSLEWDSIIWDPIIGSYYATLDGEYATYRLWIECERSIGEKMRIFEEMGLAGVASWRRGLESPGVWEEIRRAIS